MTTLRTLLALALLVGCSSVGTTRTDPADSPNGDGDVTVGDEAFEDSPTRMTIGLRSIPGDSQTMMQVEPSLESEGLYIRMSTLEDVCDDISVYFDYDSADLSDETKASLDALAQCFRAEEIRSIEIEGHADPRASNAYNDRLAMRRAQNVATYLRNRGVDEPQVEVVSHGERAARWRFYWDQDRRVDIDSEPAEDHD